MSRLSNGTLSFDILSRPSDAKLTVGTCCALCPIIDTSSRKSGLSYLSSILLHSKNSLLLAGKGRPGEDIDDVTDVKNGSNQEHLCGKGFLKAHAQVID